MEFQKYEKIMAEYEELKRYVDSLKTAKKTTKKKRSKKEEDLSIETVTSSNNIQQITDEDKVRINSLIEKKEIVETRKRRASKNTSR